MTLVQKIKLFKKILPSYVFTYEVAGMARSKNKTVMRYNDC